MDTQNPILSAGVQEVAGKRYMTDARGALVPEQLVKPMDKLIDEAVRKMHAFAEDLEAQIERFRGHCFADIGSLQALVAQEYGAELGGRRGNLTLTSYDGTRRVTIKVADQIVFGPELQAAKALVDECLSSWSEGAAEELKAVVNRAFQVDREGRINRAEIFMLLRVAIEDERWQRAMTAVRDSIRVIGSKTYINFHARQTPDAPWRAISIDLASAGGVA